MEVIIAGSRGIGSYYFVRDKIGASGFEITKVISGGAQGVDQLGEQYARDNGIRFDVFPAEWDKYGRAAGYVRNKQMSETADALIAIWDGQSPGTLHMIDIARDKGLPVYVFNEKKQEELRYGYPEESTEKKD